MSGSEDGEIVNGAQSAGKLVEIEMCGDRDWVGSVDVVSAGCPFEADEVECAVDTVL